MSLTTDTRSNWRTWSPAFQAAPPAACQTLRNYRNTVDWGYQCVFAQEDGDPIPFSINTACMPWVTPNVYPSSGAFYSPATACPSSWSAVSTATSGDQWASGETALTCCPSGFEGDGRGGCRVGSTGTFPVVQCGEADAEENENRIYTAGQWPATATPSITALHLRYRASDIGSASATGTSPSNTGGSENSNANGAGNGGLSTGAKAAIGTVIPLIFILSALAFLLLWRRRKQKKSVLALAARNMTDSKPSSAPASSHGSSYPPPAHEPKNMLSGAAIAPNGTTNVHETPEWNVEMDATDAERQALVSNRYERVSANSHGNGASELGGLARVPRKPIAPVEMDGTGVRAEVGDAYIPYRPGG
ncbi:hypothetical protein CC86DRAFT_17873 [Ophiobolus disseminans]|uniref:Uncharacterized protein n=1 Tax=Ophiobolus disseminans TaxID=1469910 RepID=A0A6A7AN77_9PLEO|nr:hypothetical protein CC86DRAFT_17873 [Ophiobolus disseminans]